MKYLTLVAAWALVPTSLIVSLLAPFSIWIGIALIVLPTVIFVSWLIKVSLGGQLERRTSPFAFYSSIATIILFLIVVAAYLHMGDIFEVHNEIQHMLQLRKSPRVGVLADEGQRYNLLRNSLEMNFARKSRRPTIPIFDYRVTGYDFKSLNYLFYEKFVDQEYFFATDSRRPFIIDCGSHIGMSILYFKRLYPRAQIIGFEPAPDTFRLLTENIQQNALKDITVFNKAVGNKEEKMKFFGDDSLTASLLEGRETKKSATEVDVVRLSNYIDRTVDFLKLDVEGAEGMVLEDLDSSKKLPLIKQMIIEYHHHVDRGVDTFSRFLKILEDNNLGYQLWTSSARDPRTYEDIMIFAYQK